ncbi:hypothetical protein pb186bvf_006232 [Paramecium bursaria]
MCIFQYRYNSLQLDEQIELFSKQNLFKQEKKESTVIITCFSLKFKSFEIKEYKFEFQDYSENKQLLLIKNQAIERLQFRNLILNFFLRYPFLLRLKLINDQLNHIQKKYSHYLYLFFACMNNY